MKLTVSLYIIQHRENLCNTGNFISADMWPPRFASITEKPKICHANSKLSCSHFFLDLLNEAGAFSLALN